MRYLFGVFMTLLSASVFAEPIVSDITAKQRYPWNGLVDITCKVSGIEGKRKFVVSAGMPDSGNVVSLKNFWVVRNGVKSTNFEVSADGDYRLLWDAKADLGEVSHDNMVVRITLDDIHEKVQLWEGGPYWATTNIGADEPWEIGYYFYWGGIIGYKHVDNPYQGWLGTNGSISYNETFNTMYMHNSGDISQLKKNGVITDNNVLDQGYDAAFMHLGERWRMPTRNEVMDLKNNCEWIDERINGVNGYIVRGKGVFSAFSIFLPRGGRGDLTAVKDYGTIGSYWTSTPHSEYYDQSFCLRLSNSSGYEASVPYSYRSYGCNIRPVQGGEAAYVLYDSAPFLLDTTDPLITSPITYNSSWTGNNSEAVVVIADNGVEVKRVTGEGEFTYSSTTPGKHTLTYTTYIDDVAQSEVYSATVFAG